MAAKCLRCERQARQDSNYCQPCWNTIQIGTIRGRPLGERAVFLGVVVGMIREAGYNSPKDFVHDLKVAWPHVSDSVEKLPPK